MQLSACLVQKKNLIQTNQVASLTYHGAVRHRTYVDITLFIYTAQHIFCVQLALVSSTHAIALCHCVLLLSKQSRNNADRCVVIVTSKLIKRRAMHALKGKDREFFGAEELAEISYKLSKCCVLDICDLQLNSRSISQIL